MSISKKLYVAFGIILTTIIASAIIVNFNLKKIEANDKEILDFRLTQITEVVSEKAHGFSRGDESL